MKSRFTDPQSFKNHLFEQFKERKNTIDHWLKQGVLATAGVTGVPSVRTVVIRHITEDITLEIHSDSRSNKVLDVQMNPNAEILFYNSDTQVQLKCSGKMTAVFSGPSADAAWENIPEPSRKQYTTLLAPGTVIDQSKQLKYKPLRHFCVLQLHTESIEYLQLGDPHMRMRLSKKEGKEILENLVP